MLAFPLFAVHQIGILLGVRGNAADFATDLLMLAAQRSLVHYTGLLLAMLLAYGLVLRVLRRRGRLRPAAFVPVLLESAVLALAMGSVILGVLQYLDFLPGLSVLGPGSIVVVSAGAGFHEELLFRVVLMGGLAVMLRGVTGRARAWLVALGLSALLFSLAHHLGPAGEPLSGVVFVYRALAGVYFGLVYWLRGFAVAAWTHALYDVYVLSLG